MSAHNLGGYCYGNVVNKSLRRGEVRVLTRIEYSPL